MATDRSGWFPWAAALLLAAGLTATSCSDDTQSAVDAVKTATTTVVTCGKDSEPALLQDDSGAATVADVVALPSGQAVAVGSSVWIRDPGASDWRTVAAPGAPGAQRTAAAEAGGDVWVVTSEVSGQEESRTNLYRSSDLSTWTKLSFLVDGRATSAVINALEHNGDGWLALAQRPDSSVDLISSSDGQTWETAATFSKPDEKGEGRSLFGLGIVNDDPTAVGFTTGKAIRPLVVAVPANGSVDEQVLASDALLDIRLWDVASWTDRSVFSVDRVAQGLTREPTGITAALIERSPEGELNVLTVLPSSDAFSSPAGIVVIGDEVTVVGSTGPTRDQRVPVAWTICLSSS